jgi:hypothetical protein
MRWHRLSRRLSITPAHGPSFMHDVMSHQLVHAASAAGAAVVC